MKSWEEPGKQKSRSCRTQELARSSAQENEPQKKGDVPDSAGIVWWKEHKDNAAENRQDDREIFTLRHTLKIGH